MKLKRKMVITGAAGGVGRTCARMLGMGHDLILTDRAEAALDPFCEELRLEGYSLAGVHYGPLDDTSLLGQIAADLAGGEPFTLIHAAGVSPALADWQTIIDVNFVASTRLLDAVEPFITPGCVAVLIASAAGHRVPVIPDIQALFDEPGSADFLARLGPLIQALVSDGAPAAMAGAAYTLSKQGLHRLCEQRAATWGAAGGRIVSLSPGLMTTPMSYSEMASTSGAAAMRGANPIPRTGTAMDVALAIRFLASEEASFITGCDLRVDGGAIAATRTKAN